MSKKAFVLMPFHEDYSSIYFKIIKPCLEKVGYIVERADSHFHQRNILSDVIIGIYEADLIIADLTGLNNNVLYELGIAHALHKNTILLTQEFEKMPFDLRSYRIIKYSKEFDKVDEFRSDLVDVGKNAIEDKIEFSNPVSDFLPTIKNGEVKLKASFYVAQKKLDYSNDDLKSLLKTKNYLNELINYMKSYKDDIIITCENIAQNDNITDLYENEERINKMKLHYSIEYDVFMETISLLEGNQGKLMVEIKNKDNIDDIYKIDIKNTYNEFKNNMDKISTEMVELKSWLEKITHKAAYKTKEERRLLMETINETTKEVKLLMERIHSVDKNILRVVNKLNKI